MEGLAGLAVEQRQGKGEKITGFSCSGCHPRRDSFPGRLPWLQSSGTRSPMRSPPEVPRRAHQYSAADGTLAALDARDYYYYYYENDFLRRYRFRIS